MPGPSNKDLTETVSTLLNVACRRRFSYRGYPSRPRPKLGEPNGNEQPPRFYR